MKNFIKSNVFGFMLGVILCGGIVYGVNTYQSNSIEYSPTDSSWNVNNVNEAINSLYNNVTELENIKSIGTATSAQIISGRTALVQGSLVTGTMINRGAWTNTPTSSGKVTIPAGYHNGSGYVDTSQVYEIGADEGTIVFTEYKNQYVGTCTFDIKNYTSQYANLTNYSFSVGITNTVSDSGIYGINVNHSYNSTTGILTVKVNDGVNNNVDRPTFLVVIKQ